MLLTNSIVFDSSRVAAPRLKSMRFFAAPALGGAPPPPQMDYAAPQMMMAMASEAAPEMVTLHTEVEHTVHTKMDKYTH